MVTQTQERPTLTIRRSEDRGHANHGWLDSYHTFSFANYYDPAHMGFRALRVINQDRVKGGMGFGTHPHRDMEIISYIVEGALEHKDSMGNGAVMQAGEVQRISGGTGIAHSEYNHSRTDLVHFLQIWLLPEKKNLEPSYAQKSFSTEEKLNQLCLILSPDGRDGSITVHQDANIYATILESEHQLTYEVPENRYAWIQVAQGSAILNGQLLNAGDGVAISEAGQLILVGKNRAEILIFDLA